MPGQPFLLQCARQIAIRPLRAAGCHPLQGRPGFSSLVCRIIETCPALRQGVPVQPRTRGSGQIAPGEFRLMTADSAINQCKVALPNPFNTLQGRFVRWIGEQYGRIKIKRVIAFGHGQAVCRKCLLGALQQSLHDGLVRFLPEWSLRRVQPGHLFGFAINRIADLDLGLGLGLGLSVRLRANSGRGGRETRCHRGRYTSTNLHSIDSRAFPFARDQDCFRLLQLIEPALVHGYGFAQGRFLRAVRQDSKNIPLEHDPIAQADHSEPGQQIGPPGRGLDMRRRTTRQSPAGRCAVEILEHVIDQAHRCTPAILAAVKRALKRQKKAVNLAPQRLSGVSITALPICQALI